MNWLFWVLSKMYESTMLNWISFLNWEEWGEISCQFMLPWGSIGSSYILQIYSVKNHKIADNSLTADAREKNTDLESLEF